MLKSTTRHVVPSGPSKWAVKEPGKAAPNSSHHTQSAAERAAKQDLEHTGGQVVIHRPDGTIRDADTVAPGNDPHPPKDARH